MRLDREHRSAVRARGAAGVAFRTMSLRRAVGSVVALIVVASLVVAFAMYLALGRAEAVHDTIIPPLPAEDVSAIKSADCPHLRRLFSGYDVQADSDGTAAEGRDEVVSRSVTLRCKPPLGP